MQHIKRVEACQDSAFQRSVSMKKRLGKSKKRCEETVEQRVCNEVKRLLGKY